MMSETEVAALADQVLRRTLGPHGFDHVEVYFGEDHDGVQSIFVEAFFHEGSRATPGDATLASISGVANALRDRGEERFPYLRRRFVDDEIGVN